MGIFTMKQCLVVDDSRVVRKVARRIVEDLGFSCEEAEDGQKACEACERAMPDVILLDWNMPIMSGIEFLERLRQMPKGDGPKVVFCTTENDMAHIQRAIMAGANEYIMKPFDSEIIQSKFSQIGAL
jgi:two-component system chemotaxis response regulator CheY